MNLHEYQAKQLFRDHGLPVARGIVCDTVDEVLSASQELGGDSWVIKVQIHAGGRGKAGGVEIVSSDDAIRDFCEKHIGKKLVTLQTDDQGQPVSKILLEERSTIANEYYLGAVIDRSSSRVVFMASTEGGVDIETVALTVPDKIIKTAIDPLVGVQEYQARDVGFRLGFEKAQLKQFIDLFMKLSELFHTKDLSLMEINPLVLTQEGKLICLDAKVNVDGNALYRHPEIQKLKDFSQEDPRESEAAKWDLNYVALNGSIGCMVNGAGLAMGTMDTIQLYGGFPANFLDVGGAATKEKVVEAFKIILSDENVKAVLVNIFGGIVRCDMIAEGIISAVAAVGVTVPVVVRLEGNNAEVGSQLLEKSSLNITPAMGLADAAEKVVKASRRDQ